MQDPIARVISAANLTSDQIDRIVMAGGQTMTPFIEQMIIEHFGREIQVDKRDNPMESVAVGAAFMAFMKVN